MAERRRQPQRGPRRPPGKVSPVRLAAFEALFEVEADQAFANLALGRSITRHGLDVQQAAQCTELVNGTARLLGTHDRIIEAAGSRSLSTLQPAVVTVLRLASHEALAMRTPTHAAVDEAVSLVRATVGQRATGVVNAIARRVAGHTLEKWTELLARDASPGEALAIRTHHPTWIVEVYQHLLGDEAEPALLANNESPTPTVVVRPGLAERETLLTESAIPTPISPWGVIREGNPADLAQVRLGTAGVQDEGSQVMADLLARAPIAERVEPLPWLDLCAGPGGKAALLTGLARQQGGWVLANEVAPHRAKLVQRALRAYSDGWQVVVADGARPAWREESFARVMADVPCTGLGSLRRRPESRWRRTPADLADLVLKQRHLIDQAWAATAPGGVMAVVTCSPHPAETIEQVRWFINRTHEAEVIDAAALLGVAEAAHPDDARLVQLWPHRHGTDAMFGALLAKPRG